MDVYCLETDKMLENLKSGPKVVGVKQLKKALEEGTVTCAFLAQDADPYLTEPLERLCREKGTPCQWIPTMEELGRACAIDVGASAAGLCPDRQKD